MRICLIVLAGTLLGASLVAAPQTARLADTAAAGAPRHRRFTRTCCRCCRRTVSPATGRAKSRRCRCSPTSRRDRGHARSRPPLRRRQMPPWFADPAYGHFANERRLSAREIETINALGRRWRARRQPERRAAGADRFENGWNIKPDIVVEMPKAFQIPASGTINYKYIAREGRVHRRPVGQRGGDAAGQLEGAAPRQGVGAAAGIEVDGAGRRTARPTSANRTARSWAATRSRKATTSSASSIPASARSASTWTAPRSSSRRDPTSSSSCTTRRRASRTSDASRARARAREAGAEDALLLPRRTDGHEPRHSGGRWQRARSSARSRSARRRGSSTRSRTCTCAARTSSCASSHRTRRRRRC